MSLIARLGKEAQRARESRELSDRARQKLEETYQNELQGRLIALHEYLELIIAHLTEVQPPITMQYQLVGYGDLPALVLHDYKLESQRRLLSYVVEVKWRARVEHKQCRELIATGNTRIRQLIDQFRSLHLGGITDIERGDGGHDYLRARFLPRGFIHIGMRATLHAHDPLLRLSFQNLDALNTTHKQFPGEMMDESLFDLIGRFLVREDNELITEEVPEELLRRLRGDGPSALIPAAKEWESAPLVAVDLDVDFDPSSVPRASSFDDAEEAASNDKSAVEPTGDAKTRPTDAEKPPKSAANAQPAAQSAQPQAQQASTEPKDDPAPPERAVTKPPLTKAQRERELLLSASPKATAPDDGRSAQLIAEFLAADKGHGEPGDEIKRPDIQPLIMSHLVEEAQAAPTKPAAQRRPADPEPTRQVQPNPPQTPASSALAAEPTSPKAEQPAAQPRIRKPIDLAELEAKRREAEAFRDRMRMMAEKLRDQ